jgi:hypothetical protein
MPAVGPQTKCSDLFLDYVSAAKSKSVSDKENAEKNIKNSGTLSTLYGKSSTNSVPEVLAVM